MVVVFVPFGVMPQGDRRVGGLSENMDVSDIYSVYCKLLGKALKDTYFFLLLFIIFFPFFFAVFLCC